MKKLTFLVAIAIALLLPATQSYGQSQSWGTWGNLGCFKGIQARVRRSGDAPNKYGYTYYIQFRNNYSQKASFAFTMQANSQASDEYIKVNGGQYRTELKANTEDSGLMTSSINNFNGINVKLGYLRFIKDGDVDVGQPFEKCDDGTNAVDDLCAFKPAFSCSNYKKPNDKTVAANSKSSTSVNKTPATDKECAAFADTFDDTKYSKDDKRLLAGQELLDRCREWINKNGNEGALAATIKETNRLKESLATKTPATNVKANQTADLSAQSEENKADELKRKIVENLKANVKPTRTVSTNYEWTEFSETSVSDDISGVTVRFSSYIIPVRNPSVKTNEFSWEVIFTWEQLSDFHLNFDIFELKTINPFIEVKSTTIKATQKSSGNVIIEKRGYFPYDAGNNNQNFNELMSIINQLKSLDGK